ncbi:hypothetical protein CSQ89_20595 [Chitinimonas sp. BJB300]|nr:hypothetical protein CSQ89_20595 [Chitinimonas sp. BJB300]
MQEQPLADVEQDRVLRLQTLSAIEIALVSGGYRLFSAKDLMQKTRRNDEKSEEWPLRCNGTESAFKAFGYNQAQCL